MSVGAVVVNYVGGKIFYIDSTADGTYTFYNANGTQVSAPSVGDDCTGWTYTLSGGNGKDKYYVTDLTNRTYLNRKYDGSRNIVFCMSGHHDLNGYQSYNELLGELYDNGLTYSLGKYICEWVKNNKYNSTYYPKTLGTEAWMESFISIWEIRDEANAAKANGCEDWYVPSIESLGALKNASGTVTEWNNNIKALKAMISYYAVWSSTTAGDNVRTRRSTNQGTSDEYAYESPNANFDLNNINYVCILIRSF